MKRLLLLAFQLLSISAFSVIIPAARRIDWQNSVGIPGGIPNVSTRFCNITKSIPGSGLVAIGNGVADDGPAIAAAISLCPSNSFIYFPPGVYLNNTTFTMKSGVVLRGAGMDSTRILGGIFNYNEGGDRAYRNIYGASTVIAKGSTNLVLGTTNAVVGSFHNFTPGQVFILGVTNDNQVIDPVGVEGDWSNTWTGYEGKNLNQLVVATAVAQNTNITFWPPAVWNYSNSLGVVVRWHNGGVSYAGIEDMTLENRFPSSQASIAILTSANYCWANRVRFKWAWENAVYLRGAFRCEFRGCHLQYTLHGTSGGGYGFRADLSPSFNLIEDNIIEGLRAPIIFSGGAGNVAGYNYCPWVTNTSVLNPMSALIFHACSPVMNLFEGNKAPTAGADNTHGSSAYNTFFRNYITGTNTIGNTAGGSTSYNWAIKQDRKARYFNFVGNVIGVPGLIGVYETSSVTSPNTRNTALRYIWTLGYVSDGHSDTNDFSGFAYDRNIRTDLLRQVNYDYVSGANVVNNGNVQDANDGAIPNSLYLASKPSWFGHYTWPPIGPDVAGLTNTIPAEARYFGQICR